MKTKCFCKTLFLIILVSFLPRLNAEDRRVIPLDMYLIIDGTESLASMKNSIVSWINGQVIDRLLIDGDRITVWTAGDRARQIHSGTISASSGKAEIMDKLKAMDTAGKTADFSGALSDASARISQTPKGRLSYTMLITASAGGLEPALSGNAQPLLRWFRSERYEGWQVLVVAPNIGNKVQQSASAYMASFR